LHAETGNNFGFRVFTIPSMIAFSDFGGFTNDQGHFSPHGACVIALRYKVKRVLDNCGQTAVVVLAKVWT